MTLLDPKEWADKAVQTMHTESLEYAHALADSQKELQGADLTPEFFHNVRVVFEKGFQAGFKFAERMATERAK